MQITIQPTDNVMRLDGSECRLWKGELDGGGKVEVFVHRLATDNAQVQARLEQLLVDCKNPELTYIEPVFLDQSHALRQINDRLHSAMVENEMLKATVEHLQTEKAARPGGGHGWGV